MILPTETQVNMMVRPDQVTDPLYVVTTVFNPVRYRSRWKLYNDFALHVNASGAKLLLVEIAFGDRAHVLADAPHDYYVPLRTNSELWIKENAINVGIHHLPASAKYIAWVDADVQFARGDWANETVHQLQHYPVVQMWSQAHDLTPEYELLNQHKGFVFCHQNNIPDRKIIPGTFGYYYNSPPGENGGSYRHPGYAWAFRRETIDALGGLLDFAILGGGDLFMARALVGINDKKFPASLGASGVRWIKNWRERADDAIAQNLGYVPGLLSHFWHGRKADRAYDDRGSILLKAKFDPERDIYKDAQGLWQLNNKNVALRDGIRKYFRMRNEDSIDL